MKTTYSTKVHPMHTVVVAYGPHPVDLEGFAAFVDRWADLFTKAVERQLRRPGTLPLE